MVQPAPVHSAQLEKQNSLREKLSLLFTPLKLPGRFLEFSLRSIVRFGIPT